MGIFTIDNAIEVKDYFIIYANIADRKIKSIFYNLAYNLTDNDVIILYGEYPVGSQSFGYKNIIYSAAHNINIDNIAYTDITYTESINIYRNNPVLGFRDTLRVFKENGINKLTFEGTYFYIFEVDNHSQYKSTKVNLPENYYSDFFVVYLKADERPNFNKEWQLYIGLYKEVFKNNNDVIIIAILNSGKPIFLKAPYLFDEIANKKYDIYYEEREQEKEEEKKKSNLKYAEIGDSITFLYDNKYETSYDDRNSAGDKTGYKNNNGYGVLFAKELGISYENHYPQGANGRTFADYYDEWEAGHWDFPVGINIWTIFLGTNDWGTERHALGTQDDYLNNTYSSGNRSTYGAIRKIVDKIRGLNNGKVTPRIIFMSPLQRGAYAQGNPLSNFMKSAIKKDDNGKWEYVKNSYGFTLKDVVDAIKWVCDYESFRFVDLFNNSIVDKNYLNMAQSLDDITDQNNWVFQDTLADNLHPTANVGTKK